jgi:PAS domain S-box-containing protein
MTLSRKTYLIICAAFIGLTAVMSFVSYDILWKGFGVVESESIKGHVGRVLGIIDYEYETLARTAADYAGWDETYDYVRNKNQNYINVNMDISIFAQLGLNALIILDVNGGVVYSTGYDGAKGKRTPLSREFMEHFRPGGFLAVHENPKSVKKGIIRLKERGIIVASHPVLTSTFSGPVMGTLVMARDLDEVVINRWNKLTGTSMSLEPVRDQKKIAPSPEITVEKVSSEIIKGRALLPDIYGNPAYILSVGMPRPVHIQAQRTIRYMAAATSIIFLSFAMAIIWLLKKSITSRLVGISRDVNKIGAEADFSAHIEVKGGDELSELGNEINGMIEKLRESARQLTEAHGTLYQTNQMLLDQIEGKKRSEEALRKSEEKYRLIFEHSPMGLISFDEKGIIAACNDNFVGIIGSSREALIGLNMLNLPDKKIVAAVRKALDGETGLYEDVYSSVTANKTTPVRALFAPLIMEDGHIPGGVGIVEDITERKISEDALRESEKKYRLVLETNPDPMIVYDMEGNVIYFNPAFRNLFGWSLEERIGKKMDVFVPGDSWPETRKMIEMVMAGKNFYGVETHRLAKDGKAVPVSISGSCHRNQEGNIEATVINLRDMTGIRNAEREKIKLEEKYRQAQKMEAIGQLAGGIAHDFNNMLNIIMGYCQMAMVKTGRPDILKNSLQEIMNAAQRSADLVRQLLAFARKQTIAPRPLDINETVSGMINMLRKLIGENIDLLWAPEPELWPVNMDPTQVNQILTNLAVNARDSISGVGKITIETGNADLDESYCGKHPGFVPGHYAMLAVSDDGCGMDKETLDKIYEPFFTTKEFGKGTGMGLATVYGIVKQNDCFINVYSEPGNGTTFKIYFPRFDQEAAVTEEQVFPSDDLSGTETLLLVEDDEALLKMAQSMLEELGYTVLTADTPNRALEIAKQHVGYIHLLITDVVMPEMNARELQKLTVGLRPDIKCLFMSGYTANVIAHKGFLDENINFLQKPFSMHSLAFKVREALGKR